MVRGDGTGGTTAGPTLTFTYLIDTKEIVNIQSKPYNNIKININDREMILLAGKCMYLIDLGLATFPVLEMDNLLVNNE